MKYETLKKFCKFYNRLKDTLLLSVILYSYYSCLCLGRRLSDYLPLYLNDIIQLKSQ